MSVLIRIPRESDFPSLAQIHNNHNEPDFHTTAIKMQENHEFRLKSDRHYKRVIAVLEENDSQQIVATATRSSRHTDKRGHYWIDLSVHKDHRLNGIEKLMVSDLMKNIADGSPTHFWNCIRSDFYPTVEFHLDLTQFELEEFKPEIIRLESEGFRFQSYSQLVDINKQSKLLKFHREIEEDTPHFEPVIPKRRDDIRSDYILNEACFLALDGSEIIGMAGLDTEHNLQNSLTGVAKPYRNRGIATVLKALVADYAKSQGEVDINAAGSGKNSAMLKVNVKLGFYIEPAWITSCADIRKFL